MLQRVSSQSAGGAEGALRSWEERARSTPEPGPELLLELEVDDDSESQGTAQTWFMLLYAGMTWKITGRYSSESDDQTCHVVRMSERLNAYADAQQS